MAMEGLLQPTHLIIILIIVLVLFGPGKLTGLGGALGKGIKEFKEAIKPDGGAVNNTSTDKKVEENKS
jgi:sec-independent protein translocase protein TatA